MQVVSASGGRVALKHITPASGQTDKNRVWPLAVQQDAAAPVFDGCVTVQAAFDFGCRGRLVRWAHGAYTLAGKLSVAHAYTVTHPLFDREHSGSSPFNTGSSAAG